MEHKRIIMDENAIQRAVTRITYEILERNKGTERLCLVGIYSRGVLLAERIAKRIAELEHEVVPCGRLDITPYRDDARNPDCEEKTEINFPVSEMRVVIVDDVIYTGRTTRAAIDALISRGRPACIQLAVLIDRGHRELPIRPDYVGKNLPTSRSETVRVQIREQDGEDAVILTADS